MKVLVVGAGFTGLAAAWELAKAGWQVTISEKNEFPGGLAAGFRSDHWQWSLEHHYHHLFSSDRAILNWLEELGLRKQINFYRPKTSSWLNKKIEQLDSPLSLLSLESIDWVDKIRMASVLAGLKLLPNGTWLEHWTANQALNLLMGQNAYKKIWQPLFVGKFGQEAERVNLAWFWARVKARTARLGYPDGGFSALAESICERLKEKGVTIQLGSAILDLNEKDEFQLILITGTHQMLKTIAGNKLTSTYLQTLSKRKVLGAVTLVAELKDPFFSDGTYWLNINDTSWPFLAVVEHTQLIERSYYGGSSFVYIGNYLPHSHQYFSFSKEKLWREFLPKLKILNSQVEDNLKQLWCYKTAYAQPVPVIDQSHSLPDYSTPEKNIYWAGMEHVYPWDRGVNFAVKAGIEVAKVMIDEN